MHLFQLLYAKQGLSICELFSDGPFTLFLCRTYRYFLKEMPLVCVVEKAGVEKHISEWHNQRCYLISHICITTSCWSSDVQSGLTVRSFRTLSATARSFCTLTLAAYCSFFKCSHYLQNSAKSILLKDISNENINAPVKFSRTDRATFPFT